MKKTLIFFASLVLAVSTFICSAVLMSGYPGLDKAIEQADIIAVIRIEGQIRATGPDCCSQQQCFVYQCLKGDLKPLQTVTMSLYDMGTESPFARGSSHLVFLKAHNGVYSSCYFPRAILKLSPFGNEKSPEGDTLQAKIKVLLSRSIDYWDNDWKQKRKALEEIIK